MIVIMKPNASEEAVKRVTGIIETKGLTAHLSKGDQVTIIGVVGDKTRLYGSNIEITDGVDKVVSVTESYKLANKKFHPEPSVIKVQNTEIGPKTLTVMAGPCAIESSSQLMETAFAVKKSGATFLRGGAYKPRTSPYSFQGLETEGLKYMKEAREATGLSVICEVTSGHAIESAVQYVDMLQIGARNMQNFELLKEAGKTSLPILLKRGLSATIDEWLNAAEYIMSEGNENVVLCERGIRTYETSTRNTLDLSAVPVLRQRTHLPIIVDPSHATGVRAYVEPLSKAAIAAGAVLGTFMGSINGLLVTKMRLQPFIATLGTMSVFRGIAYVVTGGWPVLNIPDAYRKSLGAKVIGDVPISIFVLFAIAVIAHILLKKTRFGNYLFAVGGNEEAANLSGVNVDRTKILAYSMCGFCVAFAGMIMLANLGTGEPATGQGYELDAIAASAIGGTRMAGGKGSILGTFLGALLLAALKIGLIITGVSTFWQYIVTGIIIVIAAYFEEIQSKLSSKFSKAQA